MIFQREISVATTGSQQALPVGEWISTPVAAKLSGESRATLHRRCREYGPAFAVQRGRNWKIRAISFAWYLEKGSFDAEQFFNATA